MEKKNYKILLEEVQVASVLLDDVSRQLHKEECDWMRDAGMLMMYLGGFPLLYCEKGLEAAANGARMRQAKGC